MPVTTRSQAKATALAKAQAKVAEIVPQPNPQPMIVSHPMSDTEFEALRIKVLADSINSLINHCLTNVLVDLEVKSTKWRCFLDMYYLLQIIKERYQDVCAYNTNPALWKTVYELIDTVNAYVPSAESLNQPKSNKLFDKFILLTTWTKATIQNKHM
jgi:hypothetical protein